MHAVIEKCGDAKDSVYEELQQVFNQFPKYRMKIVLRNFNAKLAIWNVSLHQDSSDNGVRLVNSAASKILLVGRAFWRGQVNENRLVDWLVRVS